MNEYPLSEIAEKVRKATNMTALVPSTVVITTHSEQVLTELRGNSSKNIRAFKIIGEKYAPKDLQVFPEQGVIVATTQGKDGEKVEFFTCDTIACIEFVDKK